MTDKYTVDEVLLTYRSWVAMNRRCSGRSRNPNDARYANVPVHPVWVTDFKAFLQDVGPRPDAQHTLDRYPNRDGGYIPGNVRWANKTAQAVNRRSTNFVTFNGETLPLTHWANRVGLNAHLIRRRLQAGWPVDQALSEPPELSPTAGFRDGLTKGKKLTSEVVQEILLKASTGEASLTELGREYGVAATSILNLTRKFGVTVRKRYKSLRAQP